MGYVILLWHSLSLSFNYFALTSVHFDSNKGLFSLLVSEYFFIILIDSNKARRSRIVIWKAQGVPQ